jgi:transcriptional regulator with XRE-family HTH domain
MRCPYPNRWKSTQVVPEEPKTIGEHIKRRRLQLHLMQKEVAAQLGVNFATLQNWERNVGRPLIRHIPGIISFLGYDPEPEPKELAKRIAYARRRLGWTQEQLAQYLRIDEFPIFLWESGKSVPDAKMLSKIQRELGPCFSLV